MVPTWRSIEAGILTDLEVYVVREFEHDVAAS